MDNILAIQEKQIGDLVLTMPALENLRRAYPEAHITLVMKGTTEPLAPYIPWVDEVLVHNAYRPNAKLWFRLICRRWDCSIDFTGTDRAALISTIAFAKKRVTFAKHASCWPRRGVFNTLCDTPGSEFHTADYLNELLRPIGVEPAQLPLRLEVPDQTADETMSLMQMRGVKAPCAVIHPGTTRDANYWSAARWAEVIDYLVDEKGASVVISGGADPEERQHIDEIRSHARAPVLDLAGMLPLGESAAVLSHAHYVLGVDSAAIHLACAFSRPTIVLFGPTNPIRLRPRHEDAVAVVAGDDEVPATEFDPDRPGRKMSEISTDQVFRAIDHLVSRCNA